MIMQRLKMNLIVVAIMMANCMAIGQSATEVTFVQGIRTQGMTELVTNLNGNVETETWSNDYIRVLITIESKDVNKASIKRMAIKKQFKIAEYADTNAHTLFLSMPGVDKHVSVNGQQMKGALKFSYKIYVPNEMYLREMQVKSVANSLAMQ